MAISNILNTSPIIVVGMHRSGTALVTQLLEGCGVFMGREQTGNRESVFFQELNKEILDVMGVSWRCLDFLPPPAVLADQCEWMRRVILKKLEEQLLAGHFSGENLLVCAVPPWGWKDPRTSLLLPVWRDIFPHARLIHVLRDGRDAARSLLVREMKREKNPAFFTREELTRRYICNFKLWEQYVSRIFASSQSFSLTHVIRYENLLGNPLQELETMLSKLALPHFSQQGLADLASVIDTSRPKTASNPDLFWLAEIDLDKSCLQKNGYGL